MKTALFVFAVLTIAAAAQAQTPSRADDMKKARIEMEKQNENNILEMLEKQRLQEERVRLEKISTMSFSVQQAPATEVSRSF